MPALTVKNNTQKLLKQVKQLLLITFRFSITNLLYRRTPIWDRCPKMCTTPTITTTTISDVLGHITVLARCSHAAYCYRWSRVVCLSVTTMSLAKQLNWMWCYSGCSLWWAKELCIRWGSRSLHVKGQFWGQKGSGSGNARGLIYSKWLSRGQHLYSADADWGVVDRMHIDATWRLQLNHPCVAAMRPCVKLLWPLVV